MQNTIASPISCIGVGVHSGRAIQLTLEPSNSGEIIFQRTDLSGQDNFIKASYDNVFDTTLSTSIKNNSGASIATIEHLMAALAGSDIHSVIIKIDGPEVPIMDGSSKVFMKMIILAGSQKINKPIKKINLLKEVHIEEEGCSIVATPARGMNINLEIDFPSSVIGKQQFSFSDTDNFADQIASARTFGFVHELNYMQSKGLAKGASLDNSIGIEKQEESEIILNQDGLRFEDEFVRHKILDLYGDFYCSGAKFNANITGDKVSHALNNKFLHKLMENPNLYEITN